MKYVCTLALEINQYLMKRFNIVASLGEETIAFITKTLDIGKIQKALQDHFHTFFLPLITGDREKAPDWDRPTIKYIDVLRVVSGILHMESFQEEMIQEEDYWNITAIQNFRDALSVLQPLPINTFQKCEGCERYFFPGKGARRRAEGKMDGHREEVFCLAPPHPSALINILKRY